MEITSTHTHNITHQKKIINKLNKFPSNSIKPKKNPLEISLRWQILCIICVHIAGIQKSLHFIEIDYFNAFSTHLFDITWLCYYKYLSLIFYA